MDSDYTPPSLPTLNIINGGTVASDFTVGEHTFVLVPDEVVELRIDGADHASQSPLRFDSLFKPSRRDCASLPPPGTSMHSMYCKVHQDQPRRDVIAVEFGGVIIRFRGWFPYSQAAPSRLIRAHLPADTPGPWFLHCHIDWHLEAGLAVVFAESPGEILEGPKLNIITPQWLDLCPAYNALAPEFQ
ncbi:hypothetical protein C8R44DRAFT_879586 [Mycena epipterygia]|nr:hypothetical protein C8R44DRAFT_879586 [Mycena epipterygia]